MPLFDAVQSLALSIEASAFSTALRESTYWFPALVFVHVCGLLIAAGAIVFWDLRLLGIGLRSVPVSRLAAALLPWTWSGFAVMFLSGSLLVCMEAGRLFENTPFRVKAALLILAFVNMLIFHRTVYRGVGEWDVLEKAPLRARIAGAVSLILWFGLLAAGRAIGYTIDYGA
jgi:uncharacterized protein DUF6644